MVNRIDWECKFNNLDINELTEIENILLECKRTVDNREEFIDMLKRFAAKYPQCKYFITGSAWKGAYECEGEWGTTEWNNTDNIESIWNELIDYANEKDEEHGDIEILLPFNSEEEWENSILNIELKKTNKMAKEFDKALDGCIHAPVWELDDAEDLNSGDTLYELIDLKTFEKKYLCTNEYN